MNIYVKEFANVITINTIIPWIKNGINIYPLESLTDVSLSDVIITSKEDTTISHLDLSSYMVLVYEDFFQQIFTNIIQEYQYRYDYYHLKNAFMKAQDPNINTLISGSSYGLFGIDSSMLSNEVNLSLPSQDLYYSLKGIYNTCSINPNINNIVLCVGYYYFFSDLSKTQNVGELQRISKVYEPLFKDNHNCTLLSPKSEILFSSDIFNIENILTSYAMNEYKKGYFHSVKPRKILATKDWTDRTKDWVDLDTQEKLDAAKRRTDSHNKSIQRINSLRENTHHFQQFVSYCNANNINLLLVVTPSTKQYLNYFDPNFKDYFYETLNQTDGILHLLDLSDDDSFLDEDFNDMDHLGDTGATKLTSIILNTLHKINHE